MAGKTPLDDKLVLSAGMRILEGVTKKKKITDAFLGAKTKLNASVRQKTLRRQYRLQSGGVVKWSLWLGRFARNPPWIVPGSIADSLWGYALVVEYQGFVGVSASRVGDIASQLGIPAVGWDLLVNFEATDSSEYLNVVMRNTKASTSGVQTRVLSGQRLERSLSRVQSSRSIATRFKFTEGTATWSVNPGTGGLSQQSARIELGDLCEWFARVTSALRAGGQSSSFLKSFARRRPIALVGTQIQPLALQFDVSVLTDQIEEGATISRNGVPLTSLELDSLLARLRRVRSLVPNATSQNIWDICAPKGKSFGQLSLLKRRLGLSSNSLRSYQLQDAQGETETLQQLFSKRGCFLVTFDDPSFAYHLGELFEDSKVSDSSAALVEMLYDRLPKTLLTEKGNDGQSFDSTSIFGWIEGTTKGLLVCEDMSSEWADYISVRTSKRVISFYHAKHSNKAGVRASGLHEVVSQAVKNLGYATATKDDLLGRSARWRQIWNGTSIARMRRGTVTDLVNDFSTVVASPKAKTRIVIVTTALSRSAVIKAFAKIRAGKSPGVHAVQLIWLLSMFSDQCRQLPAEPVIYCLP